MRRDSFREAAAAQKLNVSVVGRVIPLSGEMSRSDKRVRDSENLLPPSVVRLSKSWRLCRRNRPETAKGFEFRRIYSCCDFYGNCGGSKPPPYTLHISPRSGGAAKAYLYSV